jgi:hypothetical protein
MQQGHQHHGQVFGKGSLHLTATESQYSTVGGHIGNGKGFLIATGTAAGQVGGITDPSLAQQPGGGFPTRWDNDLTTGVDVRGVTNTDDDDKLLEAKAEEEEVVELVLFPEEGVDLGLVAAGLV